MWFVCIVAGVVGAERQCASDMGACQYLVGDGVFSNNWFDLDYSTYPFPAFHTKQRQSVCSLDSWATSDQCHERCNFRLEITQPADLRMTVCLVDNNYDPYAPDAHIDLYHPLNGVEHDIVNISASVESCGSNGSPDLTGKIALQGATCYDPSVARTARAGGAVMSIKSSSYKLNRVKQTFASWGSGWGLEDFPSAVMPRHHSLLLWEALERGAAVRGKVVFSCDELPQISGASEADLGDGCPFPRMAGMCNDMPLSRDRLCSRCPLELRVAGVFVCLWGNTLLPRKRETLLQNTVQLPLATAADEVVVASDLPNGGCSASDYAQLSGKIVVVLESRSCLPFTQVRMAQSQGVRAFITAPRLDYRLITVAEGPSLGVTIPVHSMDYWNYTALKAASEQVQVVAGLGSMPGAGDLAVGGIIAPLPPPTFGITEKAASLFVVATVSTGMWNAVVTVCVVLIVLEVILLALLFVHQHRHAVDLPADEGSSGVSVPLGVASMGLSLSLLLIVAAVAFVLTSAAGQESMDTAVQDGRAAAYTTYANAVQNAEDLSMQILLSIIARALESVRVTLLTFDSEARVHAAVAMDFDGTWASFRHTFPLLRRLSRQTVERGRVRIVTTNGFYFHEFLINDYRTEAERDDGVAGDVATNNTGFPYGFLKLDDIMISTAVGDLWYRPLSHFNMSDSPDQRVWEVGRHRDEVDIAGSYGLTMFMPFFNKDGQFWGTIESTTSLSSIGWIMKIAVQGRGVQLNMTALLVDYTDGAVLADSAGDNVYEEAVFMFRHPIWWYLDDRRVQGMHTVHTMPSVHVKSVGNYLDKQQNGWVEHNGEFDQKDEWSHQHLYLAKLRVAGGVAVDESGEDVKAESRGGGCGSCTVMDTDLGREVFAFDGTNVLHIYNNLTVGAPAVAKTRTSPVGQAWASNEPEYAESIVMSDGTECVARRPPGGGALGCFVRPAFTHVKHYTISVRVRPDDVAVNRQVRGAQLFSQTFAGETNVRVFADGELSVNVLRRGCRVMGVPGGLPVNKWSTITVLVTQRYAYTAEHATCAVYIDGQHHGESYYTRELSLSPDHEKPYYAGRHFQGRMDNLMMFGETLTAAEVMSLHTAGELVRDVPSRKWFVAAKAIPVDASSSRGASWSTAVMVPREDIMRQVDENNRATMSNLAVQEDNTSKKLERKTNETVMVIVVIALFSVGVFLVFNSMLTRPFARYAVLMTEAAVMKVDVMPEGESFIRELRAMNSAMRVMLSNLKEYKTFMPEAIFEPAPVPHDVSDVDAPGLISGTGAVLFTDIQGSTALCEACPDGMSVGLRMHNAVMREQISAHGGYEVKSIGDAFMTGFADLDTALAFALRTQEELVRASWPESLLAFAHCQRDMDTGYCGLRVRMGVTIGDVNVELNEVMQRYDYFGPTVNRAARLEAQGVGGGVVVEDKVLADLAVVRTGQAAVIPLGLRELKGIKRRVALSLLVPQSLRQRTKYIQAVLSGNVVVNPLQRWSSEDSIASSRSSQDVVDAKPVRHRNRSLGPDLFDDRLLKIVSSTTGFVLQNQQRKAGDVTAVANSQLSRVLASLARSDGRLLNVCGTAALVSWNVLSPCAGHVEGALRFVNMMAGPALRCGLCSGTVLSGYIGTREQRFVTAVGPCVQACMSCCFWAEGRAAVAFATQDEAVEAALTGRGLAAHAGQLDAAGETFDLYEVDCAALATGAEERRGLFTAAPKTSEPEPPTDGVDAPQAWF